MIFRFGGDEFAIILSEIHDRQAINDNVELIIKQFIKPFEVKGVTIFSSVSIGISIYPKDGQDLITLVRSADMAMYSAKKFGHSKYQFYNSDMHIIEVERLSLHNDLQRALQRKEFVLYYQPQIDLSTNEVIGIEALLRWKHPEHGLISPFKFIPIAEETGAIIQIGKWVLATVCEQIKEWNQLGYKPIIVAINISMKEFQNANFVDTVISCIQEFGVDARYIELEITESVAMFDVGYVISTLKRLRNFGLRISIDDFGTGFSSLSVLKSLPIDQLKIDRSFIKDINTDERDLAIVETFITLAKKLNLSVVAEGVETEIQKEFLLKSNCDYMQGYLVSYPVPGDQIIGYLKKQS
jgi:EAL domain-containing protein (putative c-di-GMP-specific phosphodiesterase class I)